ncbi:AraC family transcriptional regulator [Paenibacillus flagellatus]|uniref:AraC family transcriptional regulator n=1 Tax=Paenibacillus flagellatus TaxID=2211139 RepID=A0A2V5K9X1_9BACL|nr:AraC family transcriptional regulator [Paenibacillus flagellatus]PYI56321.1 AraC family transcriptional regulator [Paenibacillus flagellatus]
MDVANQTDQLKSFIFRFQEPVVPLAVSVHSIGWETRSSDYSYMGLTREDTGGAFLFQYTVSGFAEIRIRDRTYRLEPGKAFFVPFAGDYHYYLPQESDHYECLFVSFDGPEAEKCWSYVDQTLGPVAAFPEHSQPIRYLRHMYQEAKAKAVTDAYKLSMLAYPFLMDLYRFCKGHGTPGVWPDIVTKAVRLLDERYRDLQNLDELADALGISKYYFIKLFRRTVGKTPIEYLSRKRMEKAVELLRQTDRSLDDIAQQVGYMNVNYFSKVFRKYFGVPPGQFRKKYDRYDFMFD